jgi:hypothetical protein
MVEISEYEEDEEEEEEDEYEDPTHPGGERKLIIVKHFFNVFIFYIIEK